MKNLIMLEISKWSILNINCHGSFKIFTNPPNIITHSTISSLKKNNGKKLND